MPKTITIDIFYESTKVANLSWATSESNPTTTSYGELKTEVIYDVGLYSLWSYFVSQTKACNAKVLGSECTINQLASILETGLSDRWAYKASDQIKFSPEKSTPSTSHRS